MEDVLLVEMPASDVVTLSQIGLLRVRAWATLIPEATAMETWLDGFEAVARHWVVFRGQQLVAARPLKRSPAHRGSP